MTLRSLLLATAVTCPAMVAAQPVVGPYVDLGGGVDFRQDQTVRPYEDFGPAHHDNTFDVGAAGAAGIGYGLGGGLRIELNGAYAYAHIRGVRGTPVPWSGGGHEQQYGGFLSGLYDFDLHLPVTPYLGAGIGYQNLELDRVTANPTYLPHRGVADESKDAFGYQGIAGVSFPFGLPGLALTAEYRFVGMVNPQPFVRGNRTEHSPIDGQLLTYRATFGNNLNHELLLGVRYAFGAPAPAPVAQTPPPANPPPVQVEPSRTYLVFFDWDRADLTSRARQIVAEAASASTHVQSTRIEVNGYTDLSGTAAYNQRLSIRRAQSVQAELVRDGVAQSEIGIHGFGETNPLVPTAKGVREPQNRRVEIILK